MVSTITAEIYAEQQFPAICGDGHQRDDVSASTSTPLKGIWDAEAWREGFVNVHSCGVVTCHAGHRPLEKPPANI